MNRMPLRIFILSSFAAIAAMFVFAAPASAYVGNDVLRIYQASPFDDIAVMVHDFSLIETAVATVEKPDVTRPGSYRSIDILKPEYAEAMATDALNFIEVRRRC